MCTTTTTTTTTTTPPRLLTKVPPSPSPEKTRGAAMRSSLLKQVGDMRISRCIGKSCVCAKARDAAAERVRGDREKPDTESEESCRKSQVCLPPPRSSSRSRSCTVAAGGGGSTRKGRAFREERHCVREESSLPFPCGAVVPSTRKESHCLSKTRRWSREGSLPPPRGLTCGRRRHGRDAHQQQDEGAEQAERGESHEDGLQTPATRAMSLLKLASVRGHSKTHERFVEFAGAAPSCLSSRVW